MIAFVILHYQTIEETEMCVNSILSMNQVDKARIVIVDNASPNGSGEILQAKYSNSRKIKVIMNSENVGFSRGNNIGCMYARNEWNPDFYVVTNNDIIFKQLDFIERIEHEYRRTEYYVLGPDIFDITNNVHQSPVSESIPTKQRVKRTIALNSMCMMLYPIIKGLLKCYYNKQSMNANNVHGYDMYHTNPLIMGACIIFARKYVEERLNESDKMKPFYPETCFYYEEAILCNWCKKNGKNVIYSPNISVEHVNGGATRSNQDDYSRIKFQIRNIISSARTFYKEI